MKKPLLLFALMFITLPVYTKGSSGKERTEKRKDKIYVVLPENYTPASFEGGDINDFRKWVSLNLIYPLLLAEASVSGKVTVSFVIDRKGRLTDIVILRTPENSFSEEVIRVLKLSPRWEPARDDMGRKINMKYIIPVDFRLN